MTNYQKKQIDKMLIHGFSSRDISDKLKIPASTVRSYMNKHPEVLDQCACRQCGKPIKQDPGKRLKVFCSPVCRTLWWNNQRMIGRGPEKKCEYCGKEFRSYGNKHYCSRECYLNAVSQN